MAASIEVSSLIGRVPSLSMAFIGRVAVKEMGYATLIARPVTFRDDLLNYVFYCHGSNGSDKSIKAYPVDSGSATCCGLNDRIRSIAGTTIDGQRAFAFAISGSVF